MTEPDGERIADHADERPPLLPERTRDETAEGWGDRDDDDLDRLLAERPPHW